MFLMGVFSTFCGLVYNDFNSMPIQVFGASCYVDKPIDPKHPNKIVPEVKDADCMYPFGFDPAWYRSTQEINYMNSFKMKSSVIYGVG
jgi:V-type H+-transporting ATPase subunit a